MSLKSIFYRLIYGKNPKLRFTESYFTNILETKLANTKYVNRILEDSSKVRDLCGETAPLIFDIGRDTPDADTELMYGVFHRMLKTSFFVDYLIGYGAYIESAILLRTNLEKFVFMAYCIKKNDMKLFEKELKRDHTKESRKGYDMKRACEEIGIDYKSQYQWFCNFPHPTIFYKEDIFKLKEEESTSYLISPINKVDEKAVKELVLQNIVISTNALSVIVAYVENRHKNTDFSTFNKINLENIENRLGEIRKKIAPIQLITKSILQENKSVILPLKSLFSK